MERFLKYFASFLVMFSFYLIIYASEQEINNAKKAMDDYCTKDIKDIKGCVYDPTNPLYTQSGVIHNENFWIGFNSDNLQLTTGYVSADKQGKMVFAGCYKGHQNGTNAYGKGDYFVFKIIAQSGGDGGPCSVITSDIVPAKGITYKKQFLFDFGDGEFDGKTPLGEDMATYIDWTATNDGECPKGFGLTANTKWYTSSKHKYYFSNDGANFDNVGTKSFGFFGIGSEQYKTTPGCTVKDKTGYELAKECFNEATTKINDTTCPSDYSELSNLAGSLKEYQNSCDFSILYSKGLLEEQAVEFEQKLNTAVNDKLASCQYNSCKVSTTLQEKIANNLKKDEYEECSKGKCSSSNYKKQSTSKNAKCYRTGNGSNTSFEWTESPSRQPAVVEEKMTKAECYGTYDTRNCRNCLKKAYKASGLNDTQINCMLELEQEKSSISEESENEIGKQFDDKIDEELEESKKIREEVYKAYEASEVEVPEVEVPEIPTEDPSLSTCEKVLGSNLTALVKVGITIIQIVGAIIAIVKGMMTLIPPILAKDADALKKASKTLVTMAIILVIIFLFRPLLKFLGDVVGFDTSCIV